MWWTTNKCCHWKCVSRLFLGNLKKTICIENRALSRVWGKSISSNFKDKTIWMISLYSVIFRLKSILFFVNWISLYFFHILKNTTIFCLLLYIDCCDRPSGLLLFSCRLCFLLYSGLSSHLLRRFLILFRTCCSHARVFVKTLVLHEFPISYCNTEWYLFFPTVQLQVHNMYLERKPRNALVNLCL